MVWNCVIKHKYLFLGITFTSHHIANSTRKMKLQWRFQTSMICGNRLKLFTSLEIGPETIPFKWCKTFFHFKLKITPSLFEKGMWQGLPKVVRQTGAVVNIDSIDRNNKLNQSCVRQNVRVHIIPWKHLHYSVCAVNGQSNNNNYTNDNKSKHSPQVMNLT